MASGIHRTLTVVTVVGGGLVGGVFFAFSAFVMKALGRLPSREGIVAMQSINTAAPTPWFMTALFGTAAASVALGVSALFRPDEPASRYHLVGSTLYVVGLLVTILYHVPRNVALATVDPNAPDAGGYWLRYIAGWTAWNHVRTALSVAAAATLATSLRM